MSADLPDPALVVLVGPSGSGKSTWAQGRYRAAEIVSSDALRSVVGSGEHDLDASVEAFALLEQIVAARLRRRLTTVIDTLGSDASRRLGWLASAREAGLPAVAVVLDTPAAVCRERNAARDRPVPASVLAGQLSAHAATRPQLDEEGWDAVVDMAADVTSEARVVAAPRAARAPGAESTLRDGVVLQLSRFPAEVDLLPWLREVAGAAEEVGFAGIALMDHLIQIPQVGRAWDPMPEPWVTLGALAASTTRLQLGTLVSPVTFRSPGITAKAAATLSTLSGGRAFVGVGAGWWEREHAAYGLEFPPAATRLDALERAIETMKALWSPGTKPYAGQHVSLPETTCYPRPVGEIPVVVGGGGARTLRIAARLGDGCNVPSDDAGLEKVAIYLELVGAAGRRVEDVHATVLDLPLVGRDRDDTWRRVEALRRRTAAATFAARHHAGTAREHAERLAGLARHGVSTVFVSPLDLAGADDVHALGPIATALR
ncbi:LLM class flavin-dependent oxidoreductase [Humibacillus xanthopallidus]|uniref:Alkanesulfonate monooxygenase SsuD/methylene tetrahydromethanopterin reductase-like flavin-dependent oxidoreductase (Luciferase family) n=1 Tax=Humibacillus xanthopallidus TaxID=412689 RepID=A0A543I2Z1_9MICO|nr:LLM class flavin-dependent oxidoreductase [Humibacillus xanthopallidus]TQM64911.1 alkanesulfonate monooxygenase SsuD/methylene tetrahydromethanopterin reductase-like flavin-dependent oxidoreductase (luciferase family) [Humibacillus xanthopallidus]